MRSVALPKPGWTALAFILLMSLFGRAPANTCSDAAVVTVTAVGASFRLEQQRFADAITDALNQAIAQARGVFVTSRTELLDAYRSTVVDGVATVEVEDAYHEEITSRFSGFVNRYEVLRSRNLGGDAVEVTVRVEVCLDARIAVNIRTDAATRAAMVNAIVDDVREVGWRVVLPTPHGDLSDHRLMEITISEGVSYVADGEVSADYGRDRGFEVVTLTAALRLIDTRTMEAVHAITLSETGLGGTRAAALQQAGSMLGREIARSWTQSFLRPEDRQRLTFVFDNVRRSGTQYSVQEMLARVGGVLRVLDVRYDSDSGEIVVHVESSDDACNVARELVRQRRVSTQLRDCTPDTASLRVFND